MEDEHYVLYTFEDDLATSSFFDFSKMLTKINPVEKLDVIPPNHKNQSDIFLTLEHELNHMFFMLGTSQGIYSFLSRFYYLFVLSAHVVSNRDDYETIKLPFINTIKKNRDLSIVLKHHRESFEYTYCPFKSSEKYAIQNIKFLELKDSPFKFSNPSFSPSIENFPVICCDFEKDGKIFDKRIPIGLYAIYEGYARALQDEWIAKNSRREEQQTYKEVVLKRLNNGLYMPYYILLFNVQMLFEKSDADFTEAFLAATYISMMYFDPISSYRDGDNINWIYLTNTPLSNRFLDISQPGNTFMKVLDVILLIYETGRRPKFIELLDIICDEMKIPPIEIMNKRLKLFVNKLITTLPFSEFSFMKYYLEISIKTIEKAEKDIITFLRNPVVFLEERPIFLIGDKVNVDVSHESIKYVNFATIMEQFLLKKRIFCYYKYLAGSNLSCDNDKECSIDKVDYPYSKCTKEFLFHLKLHIGDPNKLVSS